MIKSATTIIRPLDRVHGACCNIFILVLLVYTINVSHFFCLDLMVKNSEVLIEKYFKWWISIKLVWIRY
jgi:hypothetical protein